MGKRPPATEKTHLLLEQLEDLRISLSRVEMYDSFIRASEFGRDCQYSKKAFLVFFAHDYPGVKDQLQKIQDTILEVEVVLQKLRGNLG